MEQDRATPLIPTDADACVPVPLRTSPPLPPLERFVLSRVDGRRSVSDIAGLVTLSPPEVLRVVMRLHVLGAITFAGEREEHDSLMPTMPGVPIV
jgi:hypothetical protein